MKTTEDKAQPRTSELAALSPARRRMLYLFSLLFVFWALLWATNFLWQRHYAQAAILFLFSAVTLLLLLLLHRDHIRPGPYAHSVVLQLLVGISVSNYYTGGAAGANIVPYFIVPVAAVLMTGHAGIFWFFATLLVAGGFELATWRGYDFPHLVAEENRELDQTATWLSTLVIISLSVYGYERARLQQQRQLMQAKKDAENAARARARFLASMSHEFRTPLSNILAASSLLAEDTSNPVTKERLHQIRQGAYALLGMVEDAMDVARLENGQLQIFPAPFDPRLVVGEVITQLKLKIEKKGLLAKTDFSPDLPRHVRGDAFRFRQILVNLLDNAIKFTDRGEISVELASSSSGWLELAVEDTGSGIPPDKLEQIFEPFVSGVQNAFSTGAGLGLTICRNLALALGGSIQAGNAPGRGARFLVRLPFPAWQREAAQDDEKAVLLVEDDPVGRELVETILRQAGYRVTSVSDGARALMLSAEFNFSLLLLDVRLPGISGPELARHLRASGGRLSQVPILALTADAVAEQRELCFKSGMNDFITKPVEVKSLLAAVEKWLK